MYNIRLVDMPCKIKACMVPNDDDSFTILLNSKLNNIQLLEAYLHEMKHIEQDDMHSFIVDSIELISHSKH